ncbi:MAG: hypothetical protein RhofKO_28480 [Rhodothermales bacterium]
MSSNFVVYFIAYLLIAGGILYGMSAIGLGQTWLIVAGLILLGVGLTTALQHSKRGDVADAKADSIS